MISSRHALIMRALAKGPLTAQEIFRGAHNRMPKEHLYSYLHALEGMGILGSAVTGAAPPGQRWPRKDYWLTEIGRKALECYEFLDGISHKGAAYGEERQRVMTPS